MHATTESTQGLNSCADGFDTVRAKGPIEATRGGLRESGETVYTVRLEDGSLQGARTRAALNPGGAVLEVRRDQRGQFQGFLEASVPVQTGGTNRNLSSADQVVACFEQLFEEAAIHVEWAVDGARELELRRIDQASDMWAPDGIRVDHLMARIASNPHHRSKTSLWREAGRGQALTLHRGPRTAQGVLYDKSAEIRNAAARARSARRRARAQRELDDHPPSVRFESRVRPPRTHGLGVTTLGDLAEARTTLDSEHERIFDACEFGVAAIEIHAVLAKLDRAVPRSRRARLAGYTVLSQAGLDPGVCANTQRTYRRQLDELDVTPSDIVGDTKEALVLNLHSRRLEVVGAGTRDVA